MIGVSEPRSLTAVQLACRVAKERGEALGYCVGYSVPFAAKEGKKLKIKFQTDENLLREIAQDPLLSQYSVIVVDEAHERSLHTDILLALLKKIMRKRLDVRLLIASATMEDPADFAAFFSTLDVTAADSTARPVACVSIMSERPALMAGTDIFYVKEPCSDYLKAIYNSVLDIHTHMPCPGDIL
eukprot:gene2780-4350_t